MIKTIRSVLFGSEPTENQSQTYDIEDWMIQASENSSWPDGLVGFKSDGIYRYMRANQTAPDYDKPILTDEQKNQLMYDLVSSVGNSFKNKYEVNEDIQIISESNENNSSHIITIQIDDFEKWASNSRIYGNGKFHGETLGMGGKYYVDLTGEIRSALSQKHAFFNCIEERQEYMMKCSCPKHKLDSILN